MKFLHNRLHSFVHAIFPLLLQTPNIFICKRRETLAALAGHCTFQLIGIISLSAINNIEDIILRFCFLYFYQIIQPNIIRYTFRLLYALRFTIPIIGMNINTLYSDISSFTIEDGSQIQRC